MEYSSIFQSLFALLFVMGLIAGASFIVRKYNIEKIAGKSSKDKNRLQVKEIKIIDARNKLVIVACDEKDHLLAVNQEGTTVIESHIESKNAKK